MGGRLRRMTARETEELLRRHGFVLVSQKGSHRKWRHESRGLQVIVPDHRGRTLPIGTLRSIFKGAEIPENERTT
ncbi:MAG: type II toxin-antitoxin system HicA family toxin [Phycisphaerales bacterium]|nr:type II toxin-antitoxin system HicA family toxin [Phycisphaerales bacterium]